jgi:hypothetical protein
MDTQEGGAEPFTQPRLEEYRRGSDGSFSADEPLSGTSGANHFDRTSTKRKRTESDADTGTGPGCDAIDWFPGDARDVIPVLRSVEAQKPLFSREAIVAAGRQVVSMGTCLGSLLKEDRRPEVEKTVSRYVSYGYPVLLVANVGNNSDQQIPILKTELN